MKAITRKLTSLFFSCSLWCITLPCYASTYGSNLPWSTPLEKIQQALTGSIAHWVVIIAIALSGVGVAMGESGGMVRKGATIVFGGSIAASAMQIASFLGIAGAVI